jgi:beta-galactosidase GanA
MVMNHNETEAQIKLDGEFTDMITGEKVRNDVKIQPYGVFALVR